jgi:hypothetical protein
MTIQEQAQSLFGSAEEVRKLAYLAHNIPGYFLIVAAIFIFLAGLGFHRKIFTLGYNYLLLFISITFTGFIFLSKGVINILTFAQLILAYPEISIHLIMVVVISLGTTLEILFEKRILKNKLFYLSFPFVLLILGYINILHPHAPVHTESDMFIHLIMGTLLTLSGLFTIINRLTKGTSSKIFLCLGTLCLVVVGSMFATYKDSPIAYEYVFPQKSFIGKYVDVGDIGIIYIYTDHIEPQAIKIRSGGKVKFVQVDSSFHDFASGPHPIHNVYPPLNVGILRQGEIHEIAFLQTGNFGFHDHLHDQNVKLQGKILVYD